MAWDKWLRAIMDRQERIEAKLDRALALLEPAPVVIEDVPPTDDELDEMAAMLADEYLWGTYAAAELVDRADSIPLDDLPLLLRFEQAHGNRKTVIAALTANMDREDVSDADDGEDGGDGAIV